MKSILKNLALSLGFMVFGLLACIYGVLVGNPLTLTIGGFLIILGMITVDS